MKKLLALLCLGLLASGARAARAEVSFDASQVYQFFGDGRWNGSDRHFGFSFDVGGDVEAGFFFEEGLWNWRGDVGEPAPNFVNLGVSLQGLRVIKYFNNYLGAGIDIGNAQATIRAQGGTTAAAGATGPLSQTKPFVDLLGRGRFLMKSSGGVTSGLHLDLGYRFLDINDFAAAGVIGPAGEKTLDDLNAVLLGLGVHITF